MTHADAYAMLSALAAFGALIVQVVSAVHDRRS